MAWWKVLPVLIAVICIGTDALEIPYDVNIYNVTLNSCSVRFARRDDALLCETKVQAKFLSTDIVTINSTVNEVLVSGLKSNIRYEVRVRCFADNGSASAYSSPVELRTYPNGSTVTVSSPLPRVFTAFLDPIPGATEWELEIIRVNTGIRNNYILDKPYKIFRNAIPDTTYSLRARISRVNTTLLDETVSPYGATVTATTAKLSLFGRVVLLTQLYDSDLDSKSSEKYATASRLWEKSLFEQYSSTQPKTAQVKILEFESDTSGTIAHHEILVSGPTLPDISSLTLEDSSLYSGLKVTADVNPAYQYVMYDAGTNWDLDCTSGGDDDRCEGSDQRIFLLNRHDGTTEVFDFTDTESRDKIAATTFVLMEGNVLKAGTLTFELFENSMYGIDQNYLFKTSESDDATSLLYSRRYGSYDSFTTDGLNETLTYSTGPEKVQTDGITYRVSKDLAAITIQMPPIYRAHTYTFSIDGTQNILTDLDSSAAMEATFGGLSPSKDYCITISVTINHPDGTPATSPTNCFEFHSGSPNSTSCRVVGVTPGNFRVTFEKIRFSTSYIVEISNATYARNYTTDDLDYLVTEDIAPRAVYSVQVATKNPFGVGMFSESKLTKFWSFADITNSSITLKWDNEAEDLSYDVGIDKVNRLIPVNPNHVVINELEAGITYNINVTAIQSDGSVFLFTDQQITGPPMPNIRLQNKTEHSMWIAWDSSVGVDYHLVNITGGGVDRSYISYSATTSESFSDLMSGARYAITVSFHNTAGSSQATHEFVTDFAIPSNITLVPTTNNSLSLAWNDIKGANSFLLTARSLENSSWVSTITVTTAHANLNDLAPGTNYSINIIAEYDEGRSESSKTYYQVTVPASPTNLTMQRNSKNSIEIVWGLVKGAEFYTVKIEGLGSAEETPLTTKKLPNLHPNTGYNIKVTAHNMAGASLGLVERFFTEFLVPGNITVSEVKSHGFVLNWTGSADADQYEIGVGSLGPTHSTNTTAYQITGLQAFTNYSVEIRAKYDEGQSNWARAIHVVTGVAAPADLYLSSTTSNSVKVAWTAVAGAEFYVFDIDGRDELNTTITEASFFDLASGTKHLVRVRAYGSAGPSDYAQINVETIPSPPHGLVITNSTDTSVSVSWNASKGADEYFVFVSTANGNQVSGLDGTGTTTGTSVTISGLNPTTGYLIKVSARSAAGNGTFSVSMRIEAAPLPPNNVTLISRTSESLKITWDEVMNVSQYGVSVYEYSTKTSDTSVEIPNLEAGTVYPVSIVSVSRSGRTSSQLQHDFQTLPNSPSLTIVSSLSTSMDLVWQTKKGAEKYNITIVSHSTGSVLTDVSTSLNLTFHNLTACTSYMINATSSYEGEHSSPPSTIIGFTLCLPPSGIQVISVTQTSVELSWNPSPGEVKYDIVVQSGSRKRRSSDDDPKITADSDGGKVENLAAGSSYTLKVVAENSAGRSESDAINVKTGLRNPASLLLVNVTTTSVTLEWDVQEGATNYSLSYFLISEISKLTGLVNRATVDTLTPGSSYVFSIQTLSVTQPGSKTFQNTYMVPNITVMTVPIPPKDLKVEKIGDQLVVTWKKTNGASLYFVHMETGSTILPITFNTTDLNITVAMASYKKFSFMVSAMNVQSRMSAQSDTLLYTVDDNTPDRRPEIPWWIIIVACAALVVIIVFVFLLIWRKRRRQTGYFDFRTPDPARIRDVVADNIELNRLDEGHLGPQSPTLRNERPQNRDDEAGTTDDTQQEQQNDENNIEAREDDNDTTPPPTTHVNISDEPAGTTDDTQQEQENDENNIGEGGDDNEMTEPPTADSEQPGTPSENADVNISEPAGTTDDTRQERQIDDTNADRAEDDKSAENTLASEKLTEEKETP